jgi:hypothetical protein
VNGFTGGNKLLFTLSTERFKVINLSKSVAISASFSELAGRSIPRISSTAIRQIHFCWAVTSTSLNQYLSGRHP